MSYIYTFIRSDIPFEQQIVQIGHACYEAGKRFKDDLGISSLVLLSVTGKDELADVSYRLDLSSIDHYMFFEPDNGMGYSAICTRPITDKKERSFFSKWSLHRLTPVA